MVLLVGGIVSSLLYVDFASEIPESFGARDAQFLLQVELSIGRRA